MTDRLLWLVPFALLALLALAVVLGLPSVGVIGAACAAGTFATAGYYSRRDRRVERRL